MASSDRIIGFSTGAIARGDFRRALRALAETGVPAVELSALREHELPELMHSLGQLNLRGFTYVSVHAPAKFVELPEGEVVRLLQAAASLRLPIVVHPDTIQSSDLWKPFGALLLIENMDKRKLVGRTAAELRATFERLPEAGLCLDVAHSRQVDPSMIETTQMLSEFQSRLREIHASGVTTRGIHGLISTAASSAYGSIAHMIPGTVPVILESPVDESAIRDEISFARSAFSPWLERLRADIEDVLDLKMPALRRVQAENFLKTLRMTRVRLSDFDSVIGHLPTGGAFSSGDVLFSAYDLLSRLSEREKCELKEYLLARAQKLAREYPDLRSEFREQFTGVE